MANPLGGPTHRCQPKAQPPNPTTPRDLPGGDRHRGIIVDAAGQALAHTHLVHHLERSVWAVLTDTCDVALGCRNGIAESLDAIKAATGKDVAHIRYSDVCEGQTG